MKTINLTVKGITCGNCVKHVDHAIRSISGVQQVDIDLKSAIAVVQSSEEATSALIIKALNEAGYPSMEIGPEVKTSLANKSCCMGESNCCN